MYKMDEIFNLMGWFLYGFLFCSGLVLALAFYLTLADVFGFISVDTYFRKNNVDEVEYVNEEPSDLKLVTIETEPVVDDDEPFIITENNAVGKATITINCAKASRVFMIVGDKILDLKRMGDTVKIILHQRMLYIDDLTFGYLSVDDMISITVDDRTIFFSNGLPTQNLVEERIKDMNKDKQFT